MYHEGKLQEINDYCLCDTLDTYFVFLRTRVLTGDINPDQEEELRSKARRATRIEDGGVPGARAVSRGVEAGEE